MDGVSAKHHAMCLGAAAAAAAAAAASWAPAPGVFMIMFRCNDPAANAEHPLDPIAPNEVLLAAAACKQKAAALGLDELRFNTITLKVWWEWWGGPAARPPASRSLPASG